MAARKAKASPEAVTLVDLARGWYDALLACPWAQQVDIPPLEKCTRYHCRAFQWDSHVGAHAVLLPAPGATAFYVLRVEKVINALKIDLKTVNTCALDDVPRIRGTVTVGGRPEEILTTIPDVEIPTACIAAYHPCSAVRWTSNNHPPPEFFRATLEEHASGFFRHSKDFRWKPGQSKEVRTSLEKTQAGLQSRWDF